MFYSDSFEKDYLTCPRKAFLGRMLGVKSTRPLSFLEQGNEVDDCLSAMLRDELDDEAPYSDFARTIAKRAVDLLAEHGLRVLHAQYPIVIRDFAAGWEGYLGFVDLVCVDEQGRVWVVDVKAVSRVDRGSLRHDPQLMKYRWGLEHAHRTRPSKWDEKNERDAEPVEVFRAAQLQLLRDDGSTGCVLTEKGNKPSTARGNLRTTWKQWSASCRAQGHDPSKYEDKVRPVLDEIVWARLVPHESSELARRDAWNASRQLARKIAMDNARPRIGGTSFFGPADRSLRDRLNMYPALNDVRGPRKHDQGGECNPNTPLATRCYLAEHCHDVQDGHVEPHEPDAELYRISRRGRRRKK